MLGILLTAVAGALDATAFLALGSVFASVMTGNLVVLGVAAGSGNGELATSAGFALLGYAVGAVGGAAVSGGGRVGPPAALGGELVLLVAFSAVWVAVRGDPTGDVRWVLLALAAGAMGVQGAAVRALGPPGFSTTYFTGTLTGVLADVVGPARDGRDGRVRAVARLLTLPAAAGLAALVLTRSAAWLPAVPLPCLAFAIVLAVRGGRSG